MRASGKYHEIKKQTEADIVLAMNAIDAALSNVLDGIAFIRKHPDCASMSSLKDVDEVFTWSAKLAELKRIKQIIDGEEEEE